MDIHIVAAGETVAAIAAAYGVPLSLLMAINGLTQPERLSVGQAVLIAYPEEQHTVAYGQTLFAIAAAYGLTVEELYRLNPQLQGQPLLYPGQTVYLRYQQQPGRPLIIGGYVYQFVERGLLRSTLPYLSSLHIFTYGFNAEGTLLPLADDEELVLMARSQGVRPLLVLAPLSEQGQFNNELLSAVLGNAVARQRLQNELLNAVEDKGYGGVDLDFEYVKASDAAAYSSFAAELAAALHAYGYQLSIALAPKTRADQPGLLYEGHDYAALGRVADTVLLMTYEWGYSYGPPMAVAPLPEVRPVAEYGRREIAASKLLLGMPNYGYDWTLPYQQGRRAISIGNEQALDIAWRNQAAISFDEGAMAPYFHYYTPEGVEHVVWFEDCRSVLAKLRLVEELQLGGLGYWTLMRPFSQNWMTLTLQGVTPLSV